MAKSLFPSDMLKSGSGVQSRFTLVQSDDQLWCTIMERLTLASLFIEEVQDRPFLQQLDEASLQLHYNQFMYEAKKM